MAIVILLINEHGLCGDCLEEDDMLARSAYQVKCTSLSNYHFHEGSKTVCKRDSYHMESYELVSADRLTATAT